VTADTFNFCGACRTIQKEGFSITSVHSKFLVHWIGGDLVKKEKNRVLTDAMAKDYAKRLKDDYQNGLRTIRQKEPRFFQKSR
jgi:hypothetical protein